MKRILLSMLLGAWPAILTAQSNSEFDVTSLARDMERQFEACPRREIVAQFERKHHKLVWEKEVWGPPADVFADVKSNDSILYPYILTIEFSLTFALGTEHQSRADAEKDTALEQIALPLWAEARKAKYRNTYLAGKDGIRLKARELLRDKAGVPGSWEERPAWPDACWDQIAAK